MEIFIAWCTSDMGHFHVIKAETIGQGVQRIRAELVAIEVGQAH
jgi:alanyl-tRNA synthetase